MNPTPTASTSKAAPSPDLRSPDRSRYGRQRRPKISLDFYDIDSVFIDEKPPSRRSTSPLKSPKAKAAEEEPRFEIRDEFTKIDDLGMKVANNFKTNLQRGLDDTIKERKFFKSLSEKVELPNVVDVTKVFKLITPKSPVVLDVGEKKSPRNPVKTYSNKRKHGGESFVVESFGLPDEPIIPVNSPFTPERDIQIDIDLNTCDDVNLRSPWSLGDEFQVVPFCGGDNVMEEFNENCFKRRSVRDLFSPVLNESSQCKDKDVSEVKRKSGKKSKNIELSESKKHQKEITKKLDTAISVKKDSKNESKKIISKNYTENLKNYKNKSVNKTKLKSSEVVENKRILRSTTDSIKTDDIITIEDLPVKEDSTVNIKSPRSKSNLTTIEDPLINSKLLRSNTRSVTSKEELKLRDVSLSSMSLRSRGNLVVTEENSSTESHRSKVDIIVIEDSPMGEYLTDTKSMESSTKSLKSKLNLSAAENSSKMMKSLEPKGDPVIVIKDLLMEVPSMYTQSMEGGLPRTKSLRSKSNLTVVENSSKKMKCIEPIGDPVIVSEDSLMEESSTHTQVMEGDLSRTKSLRSKSNLTVAEDSSKKIKSLKPKGDPIIVIEDLPMDECSTHTQSMEEGLSRTKSLRSKSNLTVVEDSSKMMKCFKATDDPIVIEDSPVKEDFSVKIKSPISKEDLSMTEYLKEDKESQRSSSPLYIKTSKPLINPINLSKMICKSQVRVILNPLSCISKLPKGSLIEKTVVPNPFVCKSKKLKNSFKQKRKLRSSSNIILNNISKDTVNVTRKVLKNVHNKSKKQELEQPDIKPEVLDIKNIKTEIPEYNVGDLAWAKIGTYPYWPCMITEEPNLGQYRKFIPNRVLPMYHVRFFGDKGRRSWVTTSKIMLYCSKEDLENIAKVLKDENKLNSSLIKESYEVKPSRIEKWQSGVDEAESLKNKSVDERLNYFFEMFASKREKKNKMMEEISIKEELLDTVLESGTSKGRKTMRSSENFKNKKQKTLEENVREQSGDTKRKVKNDNQKGKKLSQFGDNKKLESPKKTLRKTEIKKNDKSEDFQESPKKTNKKQSKEEIPEENFQEFTEEIQTSDTRKKLRNFQVKEDEPTKKHPEELIKKPEEIKQIKRSSVEETEEIDYSPPKLRNKRHLMPDNSDTDSKFSDNSSVPASLESQAALYRRNNIFRGIPKEKVCQICEKSGDVFKCKGSCNGVYHYTCAVSYQQTKEDKTEETPPKKDEVVNIPQSESEDGVKSNVEIISVNSKKPIANLSSSPNYKDMSLAEKIDFRMKEIMKNFDYQSVYSESTDSSSEEFIMDESFEKVDKNKNESKLALTVTSKPSKKEVPIIKHVTADTINYICVSNENPKQKEMNELMKDTLKNLKCTWCSTGETPSCLVCHNEESKLGSKVRQKCSLHQCGKYYHPECLKVWPQTQWSLIRSTKDKTYDTFVCPRHVCHTCISDDPRAANSRCPSDKVVKCLRCPATYHSSNYCVPAGTQIMSSSQIVCPRHFQKSPRKRNFQQTINTNWCLICSKGGDLICCETCPTSVHVECLPGDQDADDRFFCEDCQSGRLPLYDEIVWVKLGTYRWWPAIILFPNEVPENVRNVAHNEGEFVVKFFGTYDHFWVSRGRTFLFQEGDKGYSHSKRKRVDGAFVKAIEEAAAAHHLKKQFKCSKMAEKNSGLKPPPYIRIKVNKPVGNVRQFDGNTSNTTSCDCDPNQPHPCGPDSDCLNRLLLTECNPEVCPAGDRCNNQCFEKREYPPLVPHRTQVRGWGLKTLAPIRKGQFVIEYVGEMIDEQEYQRRVQKMHEQKEENYYFLTIDKDRMLDAGPKGNVARFMNHSCQPNCETQKWTVNGDTRVGLFANCDIPADTELTFNYNLECIGKEKKICRCGAPNCSGFIGVKVKSDVPQKKASGSKSKKKKSPPPSETVNNDNPCFVCGKTGDVGACNNKTCTKHYHLVCAGMVSWPEGGKWICQWHNCNLCSKRTIRCCFRCVNSYCPSHSEGNIRYDKQLGFVCSEHDPTKVIEEIVESCNESKDNNNVSVLKEAQEEDFLDSLSLTERLNGCVTSTPLKKSKEESSVDKSLSVSNTESKKVVSRKKVEVSQGGVGNAASLDNLVQKEVKSSSFIPRTRKNNGETGSEKDLPISKRTRLRCANTL